SCRPRRRFDKCATSDVRQDRRKAALARWPTGCNCLVREGPMRTWTIDVTHSTISFVVRHMLVSKVRGRFNRWSAELCFDEGHTQSASVTAQIDAGSIDTNDAQRDAHIRSADFLDVARFPKLTFRSTRIEPSADKRFRLIGELTIHGVTRE